jgi:tyrosyl-tRNA synthetase
MDIQKVLEILKRGAVDLISEAELEKKLLSGKKLKIKFGADPTSADLHFGHSVVLTKLRAFQDLGHIVALVIGDFTAAIGDPSGRDSTRPMLEREIILKNAKTYTDQAFKVLDPSKTEILFNSSWLDPFITTKDILNALSKITVSQVLEREDFKTRMKAGLPVTLLEIM